MIRVLLIAEACNPRWSSVPLVGYNAARALCRRGDLRVTVATHVRNRPDLLGDELERTAAAVHYVDNEAVAGPLYRLAKLLRGGEGLSWTVDTAMAWPSYVAFERRLGRDLAGPLARGEFDLVHRITPVSPTAAGPLAGREAAGVPMIVGPINGGLPWPSAHPHLRRREREWLAPARGAYRYLPYWRSTYRRLAAVIAGSRHTASEIPRRFGGLRVYLPENGLDPERFPIAESWPEPAPGAPFRVVTAGRLVPYKGMDLLLEALADLPGCALTILGDGPERAALEARAALPDLLGRVEFAGWADQRTMAGRLRESQAFAFPSLREFGGGVVLEAMAAALPSVIVDYGGPAELASAECALLLPMAPRDPLIGDLRRALALLAGDPELCRRMGAAAADRVRRRFTWEAKAAQFAAVYRRVLARRGAGR